MASQTEYQRFRAGKDLEIERLELQAKTFRNSIQKQISLLGIKKNSNVLDAGCGTGSFARMVASLVSPIQARAIDIEPIFIEKARELSRINGISNIVFEVGDLQNLGFPDGTFDLSYTKFVYPHLTNPMKAISELIRVTRKGGIIASVEQGDLFIYPAGSLDKFFALFERMARWRRETEASNTGTIELKKRDPFHLFTSAGLANVNAYPIPTYASVSENPHELKDLTTVPLQMINIYKDEIVTRGYLTEEEYSTGVNELREWLTKPDSFWLVLTIMIVGTV